MQKNISQTIMGVVFWDFFIFDQIFLLPQVKQSAINSSKCGIYELPDELPDD